MMKIKNSVAKTNSDGVTELQKSIKKVSIFDVSRMPLIFCHVLIILVALESYHVEWAKLSLDSKTVAKDNSLLLIWFYVLGGFGALWNIFYPRRIWF